MMRKVLHGLCGLGLILAALMPGNAVPPARAAEGDPPIPTETQAPTTLQDPLAPEQPQWAQSMSVFDDYGYSFELLPNPLNIGYILIDEPFWFTSHPHDCPGSDGQTSGVQDVTFPVQSQNALSQPIQFQNPYPPQDSFLFPYYGSLYSSVEVSINGVTRLTPRAQQEASDFTNYPLPTGNIAPAAPTNMIAALWANLDFGPETTVQYCYYPQSYPYFLSEEALVIQWDKVVREGTDDVFSFGVALTSSGRIAVMLKDLPNSPGNLTIGIQDQSGEDGLLYRYNAGGGVIGNLKAIVFTMPTDVFHARVSPAWQGQFTQNNQAVFLFTIYNNSDKGDIVSDYYNFSSAQVDADGMTQTDWSVEYFTANGAVKLVDNDQDQLPDTFPELQQLDSGEAQTIMVRVTAPPGVLPGTYRKIRVTTIPESGAKPITVNLQAAVPTSFVTAFHDSDGLKTDLVWEKNQFTPKVNDADKNNLEIGHWLDGYSLTWTETIYQESNTSVSFAFLDPLGLVKAKVNDIDPGSSEDDTNPALAVNPTTGDTGLAWVRQKASSTEIHFALVNASLPPPHIQFSLLLKTIPASGLQLLYPAVASLDVGGFLVAWVQPGALGADEIWAARVNNTGSITAGPNKVGNPYGESGSIYALSLESVGNWQTPEGSFSSVLTYVNLVGANASVQFAGLGVNVNTNLVELISPTVLSNTVSHNTYGTSMVKLENKVLIAWVDSAVEVTSKSGIPYTDQGVKYALLDSGFALPADHSLMAPNLRQADYVSAGSDKNGNGVIVWSDQGNGEYLFYALIAPDSGALKTPAMIYKSLEGGSPGASGQAVAVYNGREVVFVPFSRVKK